jgi:hypothetical protein
MIGNPHPDFTFGLTLGAEYKGFDFSAFFQGSVGNDLLNIVKYDIYGGVGWYNAPKDILTTFGMARAVRTRTSPSMPTVV